MRRVERGRPPPFVKDLRFLEARRTYEEFRSIGGTRGTQRVLEMRVAMSSFYEDASLYAHDLFNRKCAYTEVPNGPLLHLHRPEADAYDELRDTLAAERYWWTATWYRNWYSASEEVVALKRNNFPLLRRRGPARGTPELGPDGLVDQSERMLDKGALLDPCQDLPMLHLRFLRDGTVRSWASYGAPWLGASASIRGDLTIDLLQLNSEWLIESRRAAIEAAIEAGGGAFAGRIEQAIDPERPHVGAVRQVLAEHLLEDFPPNLRPDQRLLAAELVPHLAFDPSNHRRSTVDAVLAGLRTGEKPLAGVLTQEWERSQRPSRQVRPLTAEKPEQAPKISRSDAITRVVVTNFQAIEHFECTFPTSAADDDMSLAPRNVDAAGSPRRPWLVLLGENGAGKSSVLKAIGLALAGASLDKLADDCELSWSDMLRRDTAAGRVLVEFTSGSSIDLRFDGSGSRFEGGAPRLDGFVRGFGATRLTEDADPGSSDHVRLGNLFRARIPVIDAEKWLVAIGDEGDFNAVAVTIARLLDREQEVMDQGDDAPPFITRSGGVVKIDGHPIRTLSDGYRSVIAMACDLMAGAGIGFSDLKNATGTVLLDELGSHLHPRWKMKITRTLREVFPSMQFIVTTHDPLCLRGLVGNEVITVRQSDARDGAPWRAEFDRIEQSPSRLRVDQLLTSEFFGLDTAVDPEVDAEFQHYYDLLRRNEPEEESQRRALRARLSQHGILGYTARDQLVYDAIDTYLARRPSLSGEERREQRRATLDKVADIWGAVAARHNRSETS